MQFHFSYNFMETGDKNGIIQFYFNLILKQSEFQKVLWA